MHLNLVTRREEGVEPYNQFWVSLEQRRDPTDNSWGVNTKEQEQRFGGIKQNNPTKHYSSQDQSYYLRQV